MIHIVYQRTDALFRVVADASKETAHIATDTGDRPSQVQEPALHAECRSVNAHGLRITALSRAISKWESSLTVLTANARIS